MIGWLSGRIIDRHQPGKLVLDVNGVGYDIETSLSTFFQLETQTDAIQLHIHTIVREDALLLYGFLDKTERALFRALIKVNGIGPKSGITILSSVTPEEFIRAIEEKNTIVLTRLPGIGKKTAERLMIEMQDTLQGLTGSKHPDVLGSKILNQATEAISALMALGYKETDAIKVIKKIDDGQKNCEQLIRQALQSFSQLARV